MAVSEPFEPIGSWTGDRDFTKGFQRSDFRLSEDIKSAMAYGASRGCQDIVFQTGYPLMMNMRGRYIALTDFRFDAAEFMHVANLIAGSGSDMATRLAGGGALNKAFNAHSRQIRDDDGEPVDFRFRINITAARFGADDGGQIVGRYIPADPPTVKDIRLEDEIIAESTPTQGSVILSGPTGSGKTTTFAALQRRVLEEDTPIEGNIVTLEEPVEFLFHRIKSSRCIVAQSEIGKDFPGFKEGIREAMRRVPRLIVIGEQRDYETMAAGQEAANTGHLVYTTVHSKSATLTIQRIADMFPSHQQAQAYAAALDTTHMIVSQVLVQSRMLDEKGDPERVCLREWVVLDSEVRGQLHEHGPLKSSAVLHAAMGDSRHGRTMKSTVQARYRAGDITREIAEQVLHRYGYSRSEWIL